MACTLVYTVVSTRPHGDVEVQTNEGRRRVGLYGQRVGAWGGAGGGGGDRGAVGRGAVKSV